MRNIHVAIWLLKICRNSHATVMPAVWGSTGNLFISDRSLGSWCLQDGAGLTWQMTRTSWNTLFRTKVWTHVMCFLFFFVYLFLLNVKGEDLIAGKWCFSLELRSVCREFALLSSPLQSAWVKISEDFVQVW